MKLTRIQKDTLKKLRECYIELLAECEQDLTIFDRAVLYLLQDFLIEKEMKKLSKTDLVKSLLFRNI